MTRYWITTDTHLGHANIARYCNRPDDYNERILDGLSVLGYYDVLIHLGDVAFKTKGWEEKYLGNIPCKKWLVVGNHDKSYTWHLKKGWDWVGESMILERYGKRIEFSHKPTPIMNSDMQIFGHFHNNPIENCEGHLTRYLTSKHKLLILEDLDYKLVRLKDLIEE